MTFPAYKHVPVADLSAYPNNARTHSEAQIAQIAASIREFGFTSPVLVDEHNGLIAGHARLLAARKLGLSVVPAIEVAGLSEAQKRALVLADNKLALNAGWDDDLLRLELEALKLDGFDLDVIGFSEDELADILAERTDGLTDPDDVPELQAEAVSKLGDVWLLGRHRLCCGDATSEVDVSHALGGVRPHLMVTDPPYGVDFDPTWRKGSEKRTYMGDKPDKEAAWAGVWALFPGDVAYVWHASGHIPEVFEAMGAAGFKLRQLIIWNKMRFIIGRGDYCYNHDPCFYGVREKGKSHWQGARNQPTIWDIQHRASDTNHGAQKPVECMQRPIENNSAPGQAVYEPFCGSGTTIIAAEMTGRACHAVELNPQYVDVAIRRWQAFTGQQAVLYGTDKTFAELEAERLALTG